MSNTITDQIVSAGIELGEQIAGNVSNWRSQEQTMRDMIAAALADARRDGAEQMREAAGDAAQRAAGRGMSASAVHLCIRTLPLPAGERQAVMLTDDDVRKIAHDTGCFGGEFDITGAQTDKLSRAIEAASLAANRPKAAR